MKHSHEFSTFLTNHVNLNATRIQTLEARATTIKGLLEDCELLRDNFIDAREQGSWATKTIIKPRPSKEFDADIRIYLREFPGWEPRDYIENIYDFFQSLETYREMVSRKTRCLTLNYSGDFHLDIVPCLQRGEQFFVFNRHDNLMEETDADGYTEWFNAKNAIVGNDNLIKVVRLIKYLRNMKHTFTAKSILLTTLLAQQVTATDSTANFQDLPTALCTISNRLNQYLQANVDMPTVPNPVLPQENFNRHWDKEKYTNFRQKWSDYTAIMNAAFSHTSQHNSILTWRQIFGDAFGTLSTTSDKSIIVERSPTAPWAQE